MLEGKNVSKHIYCSRPTRLATDTKQPHEHIFAAWAQESIHPRVRKLSRKAHAQVMQAPLLGLHQVTYRFDGRILQI